jgi:hypothetical protein
MFARLVGAFAGGLIVSGVATAAIAVYWFAAFDPKFRDVPSVAFELELWAVLIFCLLGTTVFGIVGFVLRKRLSFTRSAIIQCGLWGVAYPPFLGCLRQR